MESMILTKRCILIIDFIWIVYIRKYRNNYCWWSSEARGAHKTADDDIHPSNYAVYITAGSPYKWGTKEWRSQYQRLRGSSTRACRSACRRGVAGIRIIQTYVEATKSHNHVNGLQIVDRNSITTWHVLLSTRRDNFFIICF